MYNRIYLDHAATTPVSEPVLATMMPFFRDQPGNASSVYGTGRDSRKAIEFARKQVAAAIGAEAGEIVFTSGGSESDNLAVKGTAFALKSRGNHIITSSIEHPAVMNTCRWLEKMGFEVSYVRPDHQGIIDPDTIRALIRKETILISIMTANNEIGSIEPVNKIGEIAREADVTFHTDAVQAVGSIPVNVKDMNTDLLSLSAHKFFGPKGAGALYVRRGTKLCNLIHGGAQERGLRAGTENVPAIAGLGKAIELAVDHLAENTEKIRILRDHLICGILELIPGSSLNGPAKEARLANNCNVAFSGIDGEALLLRLDLAGIAASSGSACTSGSQEISHVLTAIGLTREQAGGSIRLTTGPENTEEEIQETISILKDVVTDLRLMSMP